MYYGKKEEKAEDEKKLKSKEEPKGHVRLWTKLDTDTYYCPTPNGIVMRYKNSICFVPGIAVATRKGELNFRPC